MNSTFLLLDEIRGELHAAFEHMPFRAPGKEEAYRSPLVCIGHVPPKRSMPAGAGEQPDGDPPFALVRSLDGEFKLDASRAHVHEVKIGILCCTYSDESFTDVQAGYHDIMNLMDRALITLSGKEYWVDADEDGGMWKRDLPIRWMTGLDKALDTYSAGAHWHPFYGAAVIATFTAAAPPMPRVAAVDAQEPRRRVG